MTSDTRVQVTQEFPGSFAVVPRDGAVVDAPVSVAAGGYVELFGYHLLAGGWFFAGWMAVPPGPVLQDPGAKVRGATALLDGTKIDGALKIMTFERDDVGTGIGFLLFLENPCVDGTVLRGLDLALEDGGVQRIAPSADAARLPESQLIARLEFVLALAGNNPARAAFEALLNGDPAEQAHGYVEYFGAHAAADGWFISGWISRNWALSDPPAQIVLSFETGEITGAVTAVSFRRTGLPDGALGVFMHVRAPVSAVAEAQYGRLCGVRFAAGRLRAALAPVHDLAPSEGAALTARAVAELQAAMPNVARERLLNLLTRPAYCGEDTIGALAPAVFLYVDGAVLAGPDHLVLLGWAIVKESEVFAIRVRSGDRTTMLRLSDCVRIERADVLAEFAAYHFEDTACGFMAYLPYAATPGETIYIEAETVLFKTGFRNITAPPRTGMAAMKQLLGAVDLRYGDLRTAFDLVLGPAVAALNAQRLSRPPSVQVLDFGTAPAAPKYSVIVPLYGRLDFAEVQMALFSAWDAAAEDVDFIYVLDDPPQRREAQLLFTSIHERFRLPFRLALLGNNVGFGPASNIGLGLARGDIVAFVNSDVFPGTPDWLARLTARLDEDETLGVVGPMLLFEDGAIQHRGMYFEALAEFGGWYFPQHFDKGLRHTGIDTVTHHIAITGACMVMRRDLAVRMGGFDEAYPVGDFEDSDLCLRLGAAGLRCGVDSGVRLYHLERKSQDSAAKLWRANLTAYNAWQHDAKWRKVIEQQQSAKADQRI